MKGYYLLAEPTPEQWQRVLERMLPQADMVEFMRYDLRGPLPKPLRPCEDRLVDVFTTCYYWGARQIRSARFFRLALDDELRAFVRSRPGLHDWDEFASPIVDPALYQGDTPILWTIVHEAQVFVWLDEDEAAQLRAEGLDLTPTPEIAPPVVHREERCERISARIGLFLLLALIILPAFIVMGYFMVRVIFQP